MSSPYDQYQLNIYPRADNSYLRGWSRARYNQVFMGNEQSRAYQTRHDSPLSFSMDDRPAITSASVPYDSGYTHQQQQAMGPSNGSHASSLTSTYQSPHPFSPMRPRTTIPTPWNNTLSFSSPGTQSLTSSTSHSSFPTFASAATVVQQYSSPVTNSSFLPSVHPVKSTTLKIISRKEGQPKKHIPPGAIPSPPTFKHSTSSSLSLKYSTPSPLSKELSPIDNFPTKDTTMPDRGTSTAPSASSSISEPVHHHVLHLEEEAEEWKDRITALDISLQGKIRETKVLQEALGQMKTQKLRVQKLLQKVEGGMQKRLGEGRELVLQKKAEEVEKAKLELRLKERLELIEYLQNCRPASSSPTPAPIPTVAPITTKPANIPCPQTHYDCTACGCRMPKAKKDNHHASHCWGRCKSCAKTGTACNGGMSSKWTPCFACAQSGVACEKPAKTREEALEVLNKMGRVDSAVG